MFPLADLQALLEFVRGKTPWTIEVFDAAIRVTSYFGRLFLAGRQDAPVVGAGTAGDVTDADAIAALDALTQGQADDAGDGHPVAGLNPILVLTVLRFALRLLASRV